MLPIDSHAHRLATQAQLAFQTKFPGVLYLPVQVTRYGLRCLCGLTTARDQVSRTWQYRRPVWFAQVVSANPILSPYRKYPPQSNQSSGASLTS